MTRKNTIKEQMNAWGDAGIPFLFIIDFEQAKPLIFKLDEIDPDYLLYDLNGVSNVMETGDGLQHPPQAEPTSAKQQPHLISHPESYEEYLRKFNIIRYEIALGNTFLLTSPVPHP